MSDWVIFSAKQNCHHFSSLPALVFVVILKGDGLICHRNWSSTHGQNVLGLYHITYMLFGNIHWKQSQLETSKSIGNKRLETRQNLSETKKLHLKYQTEIENKKLNLETVDRKCNSWIGVMFRNICFQSKFSSHMFQIYWLCF